MAPTKVTFAVLFLAVVSILAGCGAVLINEGSKLESLSDGLKNPASQTAKVIVPADQRLIGNFDDGSTHMNPSLYGAKAGLWSVSTYSGTIDTPFIVPGGANGTPMAAHVSGTLLGNNTYPSFTLTGKLKPSGYYDASPFTGIRFYYKEPSDDQAAGLRFSVPIASTVPISSGGICTDGCNNNFGVDLSKTDNWVKKDLAFGDMKRGAGWGSVVSPPDLTDHLREIVDIDWSNGSGNAVGTFKIDYWVDEVEFY